jgi:uncharacterized membrane protein
MDGLFLLAGLILVGLPLILIYLLVSHLSLKRTVADLQRTVRGLRSDVRATDEPKVTVPDAPPEAPKVDLPDVASNDKSSVSKAADVIAARRAEARAAAERNADKLVTPPAAIEAPDTPILIDSLFVRLFTWLSDNWFYAVSAVSLALAGLFLVQYGMENGLLPPAARVASALAFGAALIGAGEYIRRRFGEAEDSATAYLPSVFAGAGIVSLFGTVLSAQMLYGLIGANTAMIGMILVAVGAMVLGWFYGPLLAAIGVIGAFAAPMVLGGSDSDPTPLFGYYALITAVGLGVDTLRRWAWVSGLTVALAYVMGALLFDGAQYLAGAFQLYMIVVAVMAILIPARSVLPDHNGTLLVEWTSKTEDSVRPIFPVLLAWGSVTASTLLLLTLANGPEAQFWLSVLAMVGLSIALIIWSLRATALQDLALLPLAGFVVSVAAQGAYGSSVRRAYAATEDLLTEPSFPMTATALIGIATILSALAAWRSLSKGNYPVIWAVIAAVYAPLVAMVLEMVWAPSSVIGAYPWALHGAALAAFMVFWAERFAKADGPENRLRMSFFVLSALACISFALVMILSSAALTVALAVTVVAAAALDRQYNLAPMSLFIAAGVVTVGYRLIADPGLDWAMKDASIFELLLAYGGVLAALIASLWMLRGKDRPTANIMLDSAAWSVGGVLVSLIIFRTIDAYTGVDGDASHWSMGIYAAIWFTLALAQVQRLQIDGQSWMTQVRMVLGAIFAVIGLGALAMAATLFSPLLMDQYMKVAGPPLFNTLAVAYLLPAVVLTFGWVRVSTIPAQLRLAMQVLSGVLLAIWAFAVVRHFWQGAEGMLLENGMTQPELYSYTIALLMIGGGLFYQSLAKRSAVMRKAGLFVIGAAVAKVFFIDISGLEGLTRVFSLLVLGLSLAGLAWLNKWAQGQVGQEVQQSSE